MELNGRGVTRESAMDIIVHFFNLSTQLAPVSGYFASEQILIGFKLKRRFNSLDLSTQLAPVTNSYFAPEQIKVRIKWKRDRYQVSLYHQTLLRFRVNTNCNQIEEEFQENPPGT